MIHLILIGVTDEVLVDIQSIIFLIDINLFDASGT
jgi:hypothetical protein